MKNLIFERGNEHRFVQVKDLGSLGYYIDLFRKDGFVYIGFEEA